MNPLEKFLADMQERVVTALADVPSEAQTGAEPAIVIAIKACKRFGGDVKQFGDLLRAEMQRITSLEQTEREKIAVSLRAELVKDSAFLKANGLVPQADVDTAVKAARGDEAAKVKGEVEKALADTRQMAERRSQLVKDKVLTQVAAEALPEEALKGDGFMTGIGQVKARLEKLATIKSLAADGDAIKRVVSFPITAEGEGAFMDSFSVWQKAATPAGTPGNPLNLPLPEPGDGKGVVLF